MNGIREINKPKETWLIVATCGLGFCLASTECERYTALWSFGTRSVLELATIMAFLAIGLMLLSYLSLKAANHKTAIPLILILLTALQVMGISTRIASVNHIILPLFLIKASPVLMQSAALIFVIYIKFFLNVGIRKSILAFSGAIIISGLLQLVCILFPYSFSLTLILLFAPISTICLLIAKNLRSPDKLSSEREDIDAEIESTGGFIRAQSFMECCASIALITILLLALHNQGMMLQDGGRTSVELQISSGTGSIIAGIVFLALLNFLQESECIEMLRIIILPIVLIALYFSASIGKESPFLYFVPLSICYCVILLFIWALPRYYQFAKSTFISACIAFFAYKIGWSIGILGFSAAARFSSPFIDTAIIFSSYCALILLSAIHGIRYWRMTLHKDSDNNATPELSQNDFETACALITKNAGLTQRESEVLSYLARGRNARYISETLVISDGTARTHIMHIYQKMQVNSQQALMDTVEKCIAHTPDN